MRKNIENTPDSPIFLTRPLLPAQSDYNNRLKQVWDDGWLTNNGNLVRKLEVELCRFLQLPNLSILNNGTTALMVALKALGLKGQVITTPFTFPATIHALTWLGLEPVFCDVDPVTLTISAECVKKAIGPQTSAILGVHLFGNICDVETLTDIASHYNLRLIFDAAHAFGSSINGSSVGRFGDVTMFSLHATKLFHTAEGGVLSATKPELKQRIDDLRNFGIRDEFNVVSPGINGKMSELNAALGLEVLPLIDAEQARRAQIREGYRTRLSDLQGVSLLEPAPGIKNNQQFLAIRIREDAAIGTSDQVYSRLRSQLIYARRYFFPLISDYEHYKKLPSATQLNLPSAHKASHEILCLPFYGALNDKDLDRICNLIATVS